MNGLNRPIEGQREQTVSIVTEKSEETNARVDIRLLGVSVAKRASTPWLDRFLSASTTAESLQEWFGGPFHSISKEEIAQSLSSAISEIDLLLGEQINAILHHDAFQKLEASWRGLEYLADCAFMENTPSVHIRMLSITWREIERDLERAVEFDQSELFQKIYEAEFGSPGGSPYGLMIADYSVEPRPRSGHPHDDVEILRRLSGIGAAAFCPIIAGSSPAMFGLRRFADLEQVRNLSGGFDLDDFIKWRSFRDTPDSRFIGLAAPRILMRQPHTSAGTKRVKFPFEEEVGGLTSERYLWGNAAYAFGEVVIRAFARSAWLADIRGVQRGVEGGGLVTGLPETDFGTDQPGVALQPSTDANISEDEEAELHRLGFLSLVHCKHTPYAAFYSSPSANLAKKYDRNEATQSSRFSAMLHYTLCVSRFAHYIKVIGRDKVGAFDSPEDCQRYIHRWLMEYVTPDSDASSEVRSRRPLRAADVEISSTPGKAGDYRCILRLAPHYQLEEIAASLRFDTYLPATESGG